MNKPRRSEKIGDRPSSSTAFGVKQLRGSVIHEELSAELVDIAGGLKQTGRDIRLITKFSALAIKDFLKNVLVEQASGADATQPAVFDKSESDKASEKLSIAQIADRATRLS